MSVLKSLRNEPSLRRPTIILIVLAVTVLIGEHLLRTAFAGFREGSSGFPVWLPQLSSAGETVLFYIMLFGFLKFIAIPVTLVWLGYAYGRFSAADSAN